MPTGRIAKHIQPTVWEGPPYMLPHVRARRDERFLDFGDYELDPEVASIPVTEIPDIDPSPARHLTYNGIHTLAELANADVAELLTIRLIGKVSTEKIRAALSRIGPSKPRPRQRRCLCRCGSPACASWLRPSSKVPACSNIRGRPSTHRRPTPSWTTR